jgi:hypothetical protein
VCADGAPTNASELNAAMFDKSTFNAVNNAAGQIDFSASRFAAPPLNGTLTMATIRFRVKAGVTASNIQFVRQGSRQSDMFAAGESLNPMLSQAIVADNNTHIYYLPLVLRG